MDTIRRGISIAPGSLNISKIENENILNSSNGWIKIQ